MARLFFLLAVELELFFCIEFFFWGKLLEGLTFFPDSSVLTFLGYLCKKIAFDNCGVLFNCSIELPIMVLKYKKLDMRLVGVLGRKSQYF